MGILRFFKTGVIYSAAFILLGSWTASFCEAENTKLNYRLKWLFNASVAGDIYADSKGFFASRGLTVNVREGGPQKNAIKELELGYADFGVASADQVIRALAKGADVVVIAQLFQINPMQWIYRADKPPIKRLVDLRGRRLGITYGGNDETIMNTLLAKGGLTPDDVSISSVRFDFTPFLRKKVDVWPVYRNSQGVILEDKLGREGEKVLFLDPSAFGVNFVANSVVTSSKMMKKHPEIVKRFLDALLEGWSECMAPENQAQALEAIKALDKGNNDDIRRKQLEATRKLVLPQGKGKIGQIQVKAWRQTEEIMLREKQIKMPVNIESRLMGLVP